MMHVELKIQHDELNLILRYAVQCAELSRIEKQCLAAFLNGETRVDLAERIGISRQAVAHAEERVWDKLRRVFMRLGIRRISDLVPEFDTKPPEDPEHGYRAFGISRRPAGRERIRPEVPARRKVVVFGELADGEERNFPWHDRTWDSRKQVAR